MLVLSKPDRPVIEWTRYLSYNTYVLDSYCDVVTRYYLASKFYAIYNGIIYL